MISLRKKGQQINCTSRLLMHKYEFFAFGYRFVASGVHDSGCHVSPGPVGTLPHGLFSFSLADFSCVFALLPLSFGTAPELDVFVVCEVVSPVFKAGAGEDEVCGLSR